MQKFYRAIVHMIAHRVHYGNQFVTFCSAPTAADPGFCEGGAKQGEGWARRGDACKVESEDMSSRLKFLLRSHCCIIAAFPVRCCVIIVQCGWLTAYP